MELHDWINLKFEDIAKKLPNLVHEDASSFACGYNAGYKQGMLDVQHFLVHENSDD